MYTKSLLTGLTLTLLAVSAQASVAPDRTRVIFNGDKKSVVVTLRNDSDVAPYLAQSWIEDGNRNKISEPMAPLPPLQRIEPKDKGQVKIQLTSATNSLPQDRESMFYFVVREIPHQSSNKNVSALQFALQSRIKIFYRPPEVVKQLDELHPWQYKTTLTRSGDSYQVTNPTPWYVVLVEAKERKGGKRVPGFKTVSVPPFSDRSLGVSATALGATPVLSYVNDYGGILPLVFDCSGTACTVNEAQSRTKNLVGNKS
ncbi:TPA: fimbria/pilus periplasmic chaperone [Salmonella enterica]|nr:fimbria/pilus periplasmic chaperone [Salmonella enterica subsp. enterica serovar Kotte]HED5888830.1 fimbria/pilus periplasmic chaperone [Salmonella enterica]